MHNIAGGAVNGTSVRAISAAGEADQMREEDLGTYQMLWDCSACETPGLLGLTHRHCPNCGSAQDPSRRYFPSEAQKVAVADHVYSGADRVCPACETPSSARASHCGSCGSALDGAKAARTRSEQVAADASAFASDDARAARSEFKAQRQAEKGAAPAATAPAKTGSKAGKGCLIAILAVVALVLVMIFWKKEVGVEVVGHQWSRSIAVEQYGPVVESAWRDQLPPGAYATSCRKAERSTKKVADGEECVMKRKDNGDGTFKQVKSCKPKYREEPVYGEKCSYTVDRWRTVRTEKAEGSALGDALRWPEVTLKQRGSCRGCEREGARSETYTVRLRQAKSGAEDRCDFPEAKWRSFAVGSRWKSKARVMTDGLDCASLTAP
jgi:hypothetical protein